MSELGELGAWLRRTYITQTIAEKSFYIQTEREVVGYKEVHPEIKWVGGVKVRAAGQTIRGKSSSIDKP